MDILYIDDDTNDVLLLERSLKREGISCQIYNARSLQEAKDYLAGEGKFVDRTLPNVVLTDLAFRGGSGLDFLRWLQSHPELARIPVFCVTGSEDPEKREEARKFGAPCFTKTSSFSEVVDHLRSLMVRS